LPACGHSPWSAPNLERHGSSRMPAAAWLEIPDFAVRICRRMFIWNFFVLWSSNNITYHPKEVYAYCDNPFE
ncbi:hypothetical protein, partial [Roseburia hominis]|uniref:hypothetical protein n=1 Tax=Roseburia hominis TaxID=301301 RepID=UPI0026ECC00F